MTGDVIPPVKPDLPAVEDLLDFAPYAQTLFDIICDENTQTPLTIGIFGSWGSGKTSLMRMIEQRLRELSRTQRQAERSHLDRPYLTVWFNAWLYSNEQSLGRALILRVLAELRREVGRDGEALRALDEMEADLHRTALPTSLGELVISGQALIGGEQEGAEFKLPLATGLSLLSEIVEARAETPTQDAGQVAAQGLVQTVERLRTALDRQRVDALELFRQRFQTLVKKHISPGVLVVFVDDLDRCLPDKAVEVLEAIKLFFDINGCIFVLGIDREVIERGVRLKYRDYETLEGKGPPPIDGAKYLEKIVQIPFQLPPIARAAMEGYVGKMAPRLLDLDTRCDDVFAVGMAANPRRVKRTLNIFLLLWRLSRHLEDLRERIKPVRLAKLVVIQLHHADLFNQLPTAPHWLIDLEKLFRQEKEERESVPAETAGPLATFLSNTGLRDLLTLHGLSEPDANFADMTPGEVLEYVHLSRSAAEAWALQESKSPTPGPQLVRIPAGKFLMGIPPADVEGLAALFGGEALGANREWLQAQTPQHEVDIPAFEIGRYPVTNADYAAFVKAAEGKASPPRHWEKGQVPPELASHPVVNVTWQDAMAYCDWLSQQTGKKYRLPTEAEWEKAAGWDARQGVKRRYPWGEDWDAERCNSKESGLGRTTPVGQYSQAGGDSPYDVSDVAGNVWEWTLSKWGREREKPTFGYPYDPHDGREALDGAEFRVLRGGSFYDGAGWCRAAARYPNEALLAADYIGFRVVRVGQEEAAGVAS
jgi:formylglycine-generating enzyme required for sulfatase activity